ncbi:Dpy-30 motif-domain-containing protein [Sporodiniella umbellata]|nr:Dpy-30 motif-domain-containing protein [Sporodiniella umbellata]
METIKPAINDLPMTVQVSWLSYISKAETLKESSGELNQTKTEGNAEDTNVPKSKQVEGGVPPRVYLDKTVVPTLLEGMKLLATERPSDPLAYLGQFLLSRSNGKQ